MLDSDFFFRRNLPHWQPLGVPFFLTYRLAGSLPRKVIDDLERERERLQNLPKDPRHSAKERQTRIDKQLFALWDRYLDTHLKVRWLSDSRVAEIVRENLYHHAGAKYALWAYAIMPNHVHVLLKPDEAWEKRFKAPESDKAQYERGILSAILHSLRGYTAQKANVVLGRRGQFWQNEAYDHWVRDNAEFERVIYYIENNPVKAGLVNRPEAWRFSSAYDRAQRGLGAFDRLA